MNKVFLATRKLLLGTARLLSNVQKHGRFQGVTVDLRLRVLYRVQLIKHSLTENNTLVYLRHFIHS